MRVLLKTDVPEETFDQREMSCDEAVGFIRLIKEVDMVSLNCKMFRPTEIYLDLSNDRAEIEGVTILMGGQKYGY